VAEDAINRPSSSNSDRLVKILLGLAAILLVVIVGIVAFVAGRESGDSGPQTVSSDAGTFDYKVLNEIRALLDRYYVRPENLDDQSLFDAAVNGMLGILNDSGTYYVTPEDFKLSTTLTGSFDGIGATVSEQDGEIVIVSPIKDTPAERAGLVSGDVILMVDGESTEGWTVDKAVLRIRGQKGSTVNIQIRHADGAVQDYSIQRDTVQVESVTTDPPGGVLRDASGAEVTNIGYVYIREFSRRTAQELEAAIRSELQSGAKALIIDVRNNPGGLLDTTISAADLFLNNGTILIERDAAGREANHVAKAGTLTDVPIVMLQNRFSASASEVLTAALRENGRAVSVGETSFGKGTVNSPRNLSDGGALFVSIAEWLTPNGTLINNVGIRPDIEVIPTDEEIDQRIDSQLRRAIQELQAQIR
jgi:carboxyl-terminal processing protease